MKIIENNKLNSFLIKNYPKGVFVAGTGTDVGKTYVSAQIVKNLRETGVNAGYFKAALSGAERVDDELVPGDAAVVCREASLDCRPSDCVVYCYETAVSPHLAAKLEGNPVKLTDVKNAFQKIKEEYDFVLAEGSGGIVCPIRFDNTVIMLVDIINLLDLPVIIVSKSGLGAINDAVLTAEYAKSKGIFIAGIILNKFEPGNFLHEDNRFMIEALTEIKTFI